MGRAVIKVEGHRHGEEEWDGVGQWAGQVCAET